MAEKQLVAVQVRSVPESICVEQFLSAVIGSKRYETDFQELVCIGRGGFGKVFRVVHRIDGQEYAIKKIPLSAKWLTCDSLHPEKIQKVIREVRVLAANRRHKGIVQYHQSWIEGVPLAPTPATPKHRDTPCATKALPWTRPSPFLAALPAAPSTEFDSFDTLDASGATSISNSTLNPQSQSVSFASANSAALHNNNNNNNNKTTSSRNINNKKKSENHLPTKDHSNDYVSDDDDNKDSSKYDNAFISDDDHGDDFISDDDNDADDDDDDDDDNDDDVDDDVDDDDDATGATGATGVSEWSSVSGNSRQLAIVKKAATPVPIEPSQTTSSGAPLQWYLFIQTELCEPSTLQSYLATRPCVDVPYSISVASQILQALSFLHSSTTVHRDLKPANIFFSKEGEVRIGDFGLSILTEAVDLDVLDMDNTNSSSSADSVPVQSSFSSSSHTTQPVGTLPYAAPEQLQPQSIPFASSPRRPFSTSSTSSTTTTATTTMPPSITTASDMYSLGIILIELFVKISTGMERAQILSQARKPDPVLPDALVDKYPLVADVVFRCLSHDPSKRPTASQLLSDKLFATAQEDCVRGLVRKLHEKDQKIRDLEQKLKELGVSVSSNEDATTTATLADQV